MYINVVLIEKNSVIIIKKKIWKQRLKPRPKERSINLIYLNLLNQF